MSPSKTATVECEPYLRWVKAPRTEMITGYVESAPAIRGPRTDAAPVKVMIRATVTRSRAGSSHAGGLDFLGSASWAGQNFVAVSHVQISKGSRMYK